MILPLRKENGRYGAGILAKGELFLASAMRPSTVSGVGPIGHTPCGPACLYRYPSPKGRSFTPNGRPPIFSCRGGAVMLAGSGMPSARLAADPSPASAALCRFTIKDLPAPCLRDIVRASRNNNSRGLSKWVSEKSCLQLRLSVLWPRAGRPSANRRLSGQAAARRPAWSPAAAQRRGLSWGPLPTSPIVNASRGAATNTRASQAAEGPGNRLLFRTIAAPRRGGLFRGQQSAAGMTAAGRERDARCSTRS